MRINSPKGAGDGKEVKGVGKVQNDEPTKVKEPSKVKEVFVGKWTLWYMDSAATASQRSWQEGLQELASTETLESFWTIHKYLQPPSQMFDGADYSFFREKIKPMWEDRYNVRGGRWVCRLSPKKARAQLDAAWLSSMLALGTGYFGEKTKHICGVVFSSRSRGHKLSLWTRNAKNVEVNEHLGRQFRDLLKLSDGELTSYRYESFESLNAEKKSHSAGKEPANVVGSAGERASGSGRSNRKSNRVLPLIMDDQMIAGFSPTPPKASSSTKNRPNPDNLTEEEIRTMLKKKSPPSSAKNSDQEASPANAKPKRGRRSPRTDRTKSSPISTTPSSSAAASPSNSPPAHKQTTPKKVRSEAKRSPRKNSSPPTNKNDVEQHNAKQ